MLRKQCVLCESTYLTPVYELPNYPICRHSSSTPSNDICADLRFSTCNQCGCGQLITLQDPIVLYKDNNNQTYATKGWVEHHTQFAEFILTGMGENRSIVEVGGTTGILANLIIQRESLPYTIVDICDRNPDISGVIFRNENGENMVYSGIENVVLSHVFEHLYEPRKYIRRLKEEQVKNVFLSIPNMRSLMKKRVLLLLNAEHTFYCDDEYCIRLFESIGYSCKRSMEFKDHSVFFHFILDSPKDILWSKMAEKSNEIIEYFNDIDTAYERVAIDVPFYLAPAGYYGQMMYRLLSRHSQQILNCLDNDKQKTGLRICGTPMQIEHPSCLMNHTSPCVVLSASLYSNEIIEGFMRWNPRLKVILV
jgi:hypothetical protein